jgi:hypothetical protein
MWSGIYQHFDFVVEEMSACQAYDLMQVILEHVEALGLSLGGGVHQTTDADYPDEVVDDVQND